MLKAKPLTNAEGKVRELTTADFKRMRPLTEAEQARWRGPHTIKHVSDAEYEAAKRRGRPKSEKPKVSVTMRLDADVAKFFRSSGAGWQTRVNATLTAYVARRLKRYPPSR